MTAIEFPTLPSLETPTKACIAANVCDANIGLVPESSWCTRIGVADPSYVARAVRMCSPLHSDACVEVPIQIVSVLSTSVDGGGDCSGFMGGEGGDGFGDGGGGSNGGTDGSSSSESAGSEFEAGGKGGGEGVDADFGGAVGGIGGGFGALSGGNGGGRG